jgi:hypothetical protein
VPVRWMDPVSDEAVSDLVGDIDERGYCVLPNYLSLEEIIPIRQIAETAVREAGGEYVGFKGVAAFAGTALAALPESDEFRALCRRIYLAATGRVEPGMEFYQVVRCLQGQTGQQHSYRFHYDAYVLTVIIPIAIPQEGLSGDLVIVPKMRPIRRFYLSNMFDKLVMETRPAQWAIRVIADRRALNSIAIKMNPGDAYFFWGYRSIHTNRPCSPDKLRATAVLHYGDPHVNSKMRALVKNYSSR